jgi:hypothetical protein
VLSSSHLCGSNLFELQMFHAFLVILNLISREMRWISNSRDYNWPITSRPFLKADLSNKHLPFGVLSTSKGTVLGRFLLQDKNGTAFVCPP